MEKCQKKEDIFPLGRYDIHVRKNMENKRKWVGSYENVIKII